MPGFFDTFEQKPRPQAQRAPRPSSQNVTAGVCELCGFASDDVLLGVCADCADDYRLKELHS
jgi:hypothetical protein